MSSAINIYPFTDAEGLVRFGIQCAIFLIGLYAAHKLIIKPAIRLYDERQKRTEGNNELARKNIENANLLEHEYFSRLKEGADEARKIREKEISAASQLALSIVTESQHKSNEFMKQTREQLIVETQNAKQKLTPFIEDVVQIVYKKLGLMTLVTILLTSIIYSKNSFASAGDEPLIHSFWYSIFWPYFQFAFFIIAIIYFGKKPISNLLEKRRDDFRAKLSEAHEAVYLADKRMKEYQLKVASLEAELTALKERNIEDAHHEKERIIKDANNTSEIILKDAKRTAYELINNAKEEIKKELFMLAIEEVEKRLNQDKLIILDQKLKQEAIENIKNLN